MLSCNLAFGTVCDVPCAMCYVARQLRFPCSIYTLFVSLVRLSLFGCWVFVVAVDGFAPLRLNVLCKVVSKLLKPDE